MLLFEHAIEEMYGRWHLTGALVRAPGAKPTWLDGWCDPEFASDDPEGLWGYIVEKEGGTGWFDDVAFVCIAKEEDAPLIAKYWDRELHTQGRPLGMSNQQRAEFLARYGVEVEEDEGAGAE